MLSIDYELITDKGSKKDVNHPRDEIKTIDGNVILLQGPGSVGKSTVMNMIAIGSFGEYDESLSPSVRTDLLELSSSSYRDLSFDIEIKGQYNGATLQMSKRSGKRDIKVIEIIDGNKAILSAETFRKKYNLIYDIPEQQTKRLEQIKTLIKTDHTDAIKSVQLFSHIVNTYRDQINNIPSDDEIKDDKTDFERASKDLEANKKIKKELESLLKNIECAIKCKRYIELDAEIVNLNNKIKEEEKKPKMTKTSEDNRSEAFKKYINYTDSIKIKNNTHSRIINTKNKELIDLLRIAELFDFEIQYNEIKQYFETIIKMYTIIPDVDEDVRKIQFINQLLSLLDRTELKEMSLGSIGTVGHLKDLIQDFKEQSSLESTTDYSSIKSEIKSIIDKSYKCIELAEKIDTASSAPSIQGRNESLISGWKQSIRTKDKEKQSLTEYFRVNSIVLYMRTD